MVCASKENVNSKGILLYPCPSQWKFYEYVRDGGGGKEQS